MFGGRSLWEKTLQCRMIRQASNECISAVTQSKGGVAERAYGYVVKRWYLMIRSQLNRVSVHPVLFYIFWPLEQWLFGVDGL
jgi:hypothetical protein